MCRKCTLSDKDSIEWWGSINCYNCNYWNLRICMLWWNTALIYQVFHTVIWLISKRINWAVFFWRYCDWPRLLEVVCYKSRSYEALEKTLKMNSFIFSKIEHATLSSWSFLDEIFETGGLKEEVLLNTIQVHRTSHHRTIFIETAKR